MAPGYWNEPELTEESFVDISVDEYPGIHQWYRTGDLAWYSVEQGYVWVGRTDSQIKINGHRAELGEIEYHLRKAAKTSLCVAVDWPRTASGASGIVGFVSGTELPARTIIQRCREVMPSYMVPRIIRHIDNFPLNANGKVDRPQLRAMLERDSS